MGLCTMLYRSSFQLISRNLHTGICCSGRKSRRGPAYQEGRVAVSDMHEDPFTEEDLLNLRRPEMMPIIDPSLEEAQQSISRVTRETEAQRHYQLTKMTERKYLRNMYKIKPGEKYSLKKHIKFSVKNNEDQSNIVMRSKILACSKDLLKQPKAPDILLKKDKISPLVKMFVDSAGSNSSALELNAKAFKPHYSNVAKFSHPLTPNEAYHKPQSSGPEDQTVNQASQNLGSFTNQKTETAVNDRDFADVEGSLLLWSMRVQMKHLHESDPDHWAPHILSYVFCISEQQVKAVLKSRWSPRDAAHTAAYDSRVLRNWEQLAKGGGNRVFSIALLKKAIKQRLKESTKGASGLPAVSEAAPGNLDHLIFEHPPEARLQGVSPKFGSSAQHKSVRAREQMVNIVRDYKHDLLMLQAPNQTVVNESENTSMRNDRRFKSDEILIDASAAENYESSKPKSPDGPMLKVHYKMRRKESQKNNKLITFEEFLTKKKKYN
ncbi:uncharacterized protein LOC108669788 [Hyalella azteca]|uniref:Uncharacterized protein LOC108669788 n=1 Tax=Hyalella azteca TaxID=294128 RepID=A0A8B7NGD5_HYAAZ|nr:uncharacterized protein LOC108669788 [Hyalella azteca]